MDLNASGHVYPCVAHGNKLNIILSSGGGMVASLVICKGDITILKKSSRNYIYKNFVVQIYTKYQRFLLSFLS